MRTLALAPPAVLERGFAEIASPAWATVRSPEIGTVMVRGRVGGSGDAFNLGEMTVTRCEVRVEGIVGFACVAGRDPRHAEIAAVCDALLQRDDMHGPVARAVIAPADEALARVHEERARERAATKADFVTLVRSGES